MKTSEFWSALDAVFGETLGRSLASDLYLPAFGGTAVEALNRGVAPIEVWMSFVDESGASEDARWIHRMDPQERLKRKNIGR